MNGEIDYAAKTWESRVQQGLDPVVTDELALARVAALLTANARPTEPGATNLTSSPTTPPTRTVKRRSRGKA